MWIVEVLVSVVAALVTAPLRLSWLSEKGASTEVTQTVRNGKVRRRKGMRRRDR